jgi:Flp pilus assembly pilin Flp
MKERKSKNRATQAGASMFEYALMISLIALIGFGAYQYMGAATTKPFCEATGALMYENSATSVEWVIDPDSKKPHCYTEFSPYPLW